MKFWDTGKYGLGLVSPLYGIGEIPEIWEVQLQLGPPHTGIVELREIGQYNRFTYNRVFSITYKDLNFGK